ncbi:DUF3299 domain-containing protein [Motilimonas pumila]|uniref:DUF3299 domain-containing protein n=1 Tax=Motilimonas pumila TaxID=2303987 RepID=A0A418YHS8_9GAMM|nr:DUF3299 domain-containing protein [Motilimonas pumila]RJG49887.1 DUF3299 domain-containing protein [Motilimonas pumila]
MQYLKTCLFVLFTALSCHSLANTLPTWYWDNLTPSETNIANNPFAALSQDQLYDVATLIRFREKQQNKDYQPSAAHQREITQIKAELKAANIDVDALQQARQRIMEQQANQARQVNPDIVGQTGQIPGFLVPLEMTDSKVTQFLLVPTAGACIHTPPPPPNQIVIVDYPKGFELVSMSTPIMVAGKLAQQSFNQDVQFSDGEGAVEAQYHMQAQHIEVYQP